MNGSDFVRTLFLPEGGAVVTNTGTVSGRHLNVIDLSTAQWTQGAVRGGAAACEGLTTAGGFYIVTYCITAGGPEHLSGSSTTHHLAGHIRWRTRLWKEKWT